MQPKYYKYQTDNSIDYTTPGPFYVSCLDTVIVDNIDNIYDAINAALDHRATIGDGPFIFVISHATSEIVLFDPDAFSTEIA